MSVRRALLLGKILKERTNKNNKMTIKELIEKLIDYDYIVTRNTVKEDIRSLIDAGYRIIEDKGRHNVSYYYMENTFSTEECRVILDGVSTNKFISNDMKNSIRKKILENISKEESIKLRNIVRLESIDTGEIDVAENLLLLHEAISFNVYIDFKKGTRKIDKKIIVDENNVVKDFICKGIYYYNDRYYLIGYNKEMEIRNYRVDRIAKIKLKDKHNNKMKIDLDNYGIRNFDMFVADEVKSVELKVDKVLISSIIEKFGQDVNIYKCFDDDDYFILTIKVGINKGLVRWILKQGSAVEVRYPKELIEELKRELKKISDLYK